MNGRKAREKRINMQVDKEICMHCGACVGACPTNAIFLHETFIEFNQDCINCKLCIKVCPVGAISEG